MKRTQGKEHHFARVLGMAPRLGNVRCSTTDDLDLFAESFGPPEVKTQRGGSVLFWNFVRQDGTAGFSLYSRVSGQRPKEVTVHLVAPNPKSFREWTALRLHEISNAEAWPLFLGVNARKFCVARLSA